MVTVREQLEAAIADLMRRVVNVEQAMAQILVTIRQWQKEAIENNELIAEATRHRIRNAKVDRRIRIAEETFRAEKEASNGM